MSSAQPVLSLNDSRIVIASRAVCGEAIAVLDPRDHYRNQPWQRFAGARRDGSRVICSVGAP